jgi:CRP-like cAMP-binding protein
MTHHHVVMVPKKIALKYVLRGTFLFDLAGSFPTDILFSCFEENQRLTFELISLLCLFRTISLNVYIHKLARAYDIPSTSFGLVTIVFWCIIVLHWQTCVNWLTPLVATPWSERPADSYWIHIFNLWEEPTDRQYLICLLRSIAIFLSAGLRSAVPTSNDDILMVIILQMVGAIMICILISRVMIYYHTIRSSQIRFQDITAEVRCYMQRRQLSRLQQFRIMTFYEYRYQHKYFRESVILITLSTQMRQEIRMHTCRKLVENVTFFDNLPFALLARIVGLLKSEIFLTNDVIVRVNQPGDCMYFIASGTVAIYTATGKEVCHLEDGAHFGEIALVMPAERRVASVIAIETCELYRLTRADFARTIHPYPMLWDRVKKIAIERHEKTAILDMS